MYTPLIAVLKRTWKENCSFKANHVFTVRHCLKKRVTERGRDGRRERNKERETIRENKHISQIVLHLIISFFSGPSSQIVFHTRSLKCLRKIYSFVHTNKI